MENKANIVWIDDEYSTLESIVLAFDEYFINFEGFIDSEKAIEYIEVNYSSIDAIVVDGNFFLKEKDVDIDTKGKALSKVLDCLQAVRHKKDIPYYVLSGQINFRNREAAVLDYRDIEKVYDKLKTCDIAELCNHILQDALLNQERQLVNRHSLVFDAIGAVKELDKHRRTIISILMQLEEGKIDFTAIRKVLESLFISLSNLGVIPEKFSEEKGWINGASRFLSKKHEGYEFAEEIIHPVIADTLFRILTITQDGSHNEGTLLLRVDEYNKLSKTDYLNHSVVYGLLEVICYFGSFICENSNIDINRNKWNVKERFDSNLEYIEAKLESINESRWGTIKCVDGNTVNVPPISIEKYKLKINDNIQVLLEYKEDKRKYHLKDVKK